MPFLRSPSAHVFLLLVSLVPLSLAQQSSSAPASRPAGPHLPTLFLVGDTAVRNSPGEHPLASEPLFEFFESSRINLVDRTIDHRTTRSYITGGDWQRTLTLVKSGDFVIFQFAEEDPGVSAYTTAVPGTLPGIGDEIREVKGSSDDGRPEIVHTYGWYLRLYIVETIARGAIPILCSQPPAPGLHEDDGAHLNTHATWARQIASQQRVVFLDLAAAIHALRSSPSEAAHPSTGATAGSVAESPALQEAESVVAALKGLPNDPLAGYFSAKAVPIPPFQASQEHRDLSRRSPEMTSPQEPARPVTSF